MVLRIVCVSRIFVVLSMYGNRNVMCHTSPALYLWMRLSAMTIILIFLVMFLLPIPRYCKILMHTFMAVYLNTISTNLRYIGMYAHRCEQISLLNILHEKDIMLLIVSRVLCAILLLLMLIFNDRARCLRRVLSIGATNIVCNLMPLFKVLHRRFLSNNLVILYWKFLG